MTIYRSSKCLSILLMLGACMAQAETIAIIGTGDVAGALGPRLAEEGHRIVYGSRSPLSPRVLALVERTHETATAGSPAEAAAEAGIVVLAVPAAVAEEVTRGLGDLDGKIIIDPTNAFRFTEDRLSVRTIDDSMAERIQAAAPRSLVVKAFNTLSYRTMADPSISGGPVTIPLAGNDQRAKQRVAELAASLGFEAIDLGPLRYAREIEGMLILWMNARMNGRSFDYYMRRTPE